MKQKFLLFQCTDLERLSPESIKAEETSIPSSCWSVCLNDTASICHLVPGGLTSIAFSAGLWIKSFWPPALCNFLSLCGSQAVCRMKQDLNKEKKQIFGPCSLNVRGEFPGNPHSCTSLWNALKAWKLDKKINYWPLLQHSNLIYM